MSDFETYLRESRLETFISGGESEVMVSTIHKSKGCEYDNVHISLKGLRMITDKERRAVYVGITRARNNLSIHYDNPALFSRSMLSGVHCVEDTADYGQPSEILLQLGHRDVILSVYLKKWIHYGELLAGTALTAGEDGMYTDFGKGPERVVKYSKAFLDKYNAFVAKGYRPSSANVRFQVYWHHEDKEAATPGWREDLILLPDLRMEK